MQEKNIFILFIKHYLCTIKLMRINYFLLLLNFWCKTFVLRNPPTSNELDSSIMWRFILCKMIFKIIHYVHRETLMLHLIQRKVWMTKHTTWHVTVLLTNNCEVEWWVLDQRTSLKHLHYVFYQCKLGNEITSNANNIRWTPSFKAQINHYRRIAAPHNAHNFINWFSFITLKDNKYERCHYEVVKVEGAKLSQEVTGEIKAL